MSEFPKDKVRGWDKATLDAYIDSCLRGFSEEQIDHIAWYVGLMAEKNARMREAQQDNEDDHYFGFKD